MQKRPVSLNGTHQCLVMSMVQVHFVLHHLVINFLNFSQQLENSFLFAIDMCKLINIINLHSRYLERVFLTTTTIFSLMFGNLLIDVCMVLSTINV